MKKYVIFILLLNINNLAYAHGEDKPGPHNGFIRMPGAFHTEVVPVSPSALKIYLLDIQWKNPSVTNSSLFVLLKDKKNISAKCSVTADHYTCNFPEKIDLNKKGKLLVQAQREGQQGNEVAYELPLKLQVIDDGHGNNH